MTDRGWPHLYECCLSVCPSVRLSVSARASFHHTHTRKTDTATEKHPLKITKKKHYQTQNSQSFPSNSDQRLQFLFRPGSILVIIFASMVFCVSRSGKIASFQGKIPMHVIFVVAFPFTVTGKNLDRSVRYVFV